MYISELCRIVIDSAVKEKFKESTLNVYGRAVNRILLFAEKNSYIYYSKEFREDYIENGIFVYSTPGYYSKRDRIHFMNLFDDYLEFKHISFKTHGRKMVVPNTEYYNILLSQFVKYLEDTKDIVHSTIMSYRYPVRCLFQFLESTNISRITNLNIHMIQEFIMKQSTVWNKGGLRNSLCGLRAFALFIERNDIHDFLLSMRVPREKFIIPYLTSDEIDRLWSYIKSERISFRDKLIILLSLITGIRASDIIALKLKDISWSSNIISFIQMKTGNPLSLPLLPVVGNAVYDYILKERPKIDIETVFVRSFAPYKPFTDHSAIYSIINKVCNEVNIATENRVRGTTLFRHNAASQLLKNSVPQSTIAAVLGHTNPDTTSIYITTDDDTMRKCILSVPPLFKELY